MLEDVEGDLETNLEGNPYGRDVKEEDSIGDDVASKELEDMKRCQK